MANLVQRFFQRAIGIKPTPNIPGVSAVYKSWRNMENPHKLEPYDKVVVDTPKGTYIGEWHQGDPTQVSNLKDVRILSN